MPSRRRSRDLDLVVGRRRADDGRALGPVSDIQRVVKNPTVPVTEGL